MATVPLAMYQFPFPGSVTFELSLDLLQRFGKLGLKHFVSEPTDCFFPTVAIKLFRAKIPEDDMALRVAYHHLCEIQNSCRFAQSLLRLLAFRDVRADSHVLARLAIQSDKRNDRGIDPVNRLVFGTVLDLAVPNFPTRDCVVHLLEKFLRMMT